MLISRRALSIAALLAAGVAGGREETAVSTGEVVGADTRVSAEKTARKTERERRYVLEEKGSSTFSALWSRTQDTPSEQWAYAKKARDAGRRKAAEARMKYLYRRWPNSVEAPWAARGRADSLYERKEWKEAFAAYQYVIETYAARMADYDEVLQRQFDIAGKIMRKRRLRWLFGGYRAPEHAIEYYQDVVQNGPQWTRAPEGQFMIGKCYEAAEEYEMAITAYGVLGYRYPESELAEEAAWRQIQCLKSLREEYPASSEILDRFLVATSVYIMTFPKSARRGEIVRARNELYEMKAGRVFDEAAFYAKVPKKPEAAILYYEKMLEEYPKSEKVPLAEVAIEDLRRILAMPIKARVPDLPRSRPLPFTNGGVDAAE